MFGREEFVSTVGELKMDPSLYCSKERLQTLLDGHEEDNINLIFLMFYCYPDGLSHFQDKLHQAYIQGREEGYQEAINNEQN